MNLRRHLVRCFFAGIVALLPVGGTVLAVVYLESVLASSWLAGQSFYFPGLGLLLAATLVYVIGLGVTTFIGRWLWTRVDRLLDRLPALGQLYQTLKQILGYGGGKDALFHSVVMVAHNDSGGRQLGLITSRFSDATGAKSVVFLPGAPNPTAGQLVVLADNKIEPLDTMVSDAMKALVSVGKTDMPGID